MELALPPGIDLTSFYTSVLNLAFVFCGFGITFGVFKLVVGILREAKKAGR
jgi:hypothetical protein